MAYIAFTAVLFGAAGIAGGIETESLAGITAAVVFHIGGIIGMAAAARREDKPAGEEDDTC